MAAARSLLIWVVAAAVKCLYGFQSIAVVSVVGISYQHLWSLINIQAAFLK